MGIPADSDRIAARHYAGLLLISLATLLLDLALARALAVVSILCAILPLGVSFRADRRIPIRVSAPKLRTPIHASYPAWNTMSLAQASEHAPGKMLGSRQIPIDAGAAATGMVDLRPDVRAFLATHPVNPALVPPHSAIFFTRPEFKLPRLFATARGRFRHA